MRLLGLGIIAAAVTVGASAQTDDHGDDRDSATHVELPSETAGGIDLGNAAAAGVGGRPQHHIMDDHGNSQDSATQVALPSETVGVIDPGDDRDWFRFEIAARGVVTAETVGDLDTVGALFLLRCIGPPGAPCSIGDEDDISFDDITSDDDSGDGRNFRIQPTLNAGTYFLLVDSYAELPGSYVLHLRLLGSDGDDHGDDLSSATHVELPSETAGEIDSGDDEDWFRFEVAVAGEVTVATTGPVSSRTTSGWFYEQANAVGTLYDASGEEIAGDDYRTYHPSLEEGTYFVRVRSAYDNGGSYVLRLVGADDHGGAPASATLVELPSETAGEIDPGSDSDWFRFEASGGRVVIETTGGLDTEGALFREGRYSLDRLAQSDDSPTSLNFRIQSRLADVAEEVPPAGDAWTYFVWVGSFSNATGSYILHLRHGDDHGDDRASATLVELPSETAGAIDPSDDEDWFRFEVAASGEVAVGTAGRGRPERLPTEGTLYDADGNEIAASQSIPDDPYDGNFRIQRMLDAGTYYVRVASFERTGSYVLRLASVASGDGGTAAISPTPHHLRHLGDFDGDGRDDVLLRHEKGRWHYYPMDGRNVLPGSGPASLTRDLAWRIDGVGDFDGDGKDDVLLRNMDGRWYFYPMDGRNVLASRGTVRMTRDLAWQADGIGDFDGDGHDDVLLRHEEGRWHYYRMNGRQPLSGSGRAALTSNLAWQAVGIGDFDGDGKDDVLLRHEDGRWYFYPMDGRASLAGRGTILTLTRDLAWQVAGVGDFDGDERDDILLRHDDGSWRYHPLNGRTEGAGGGGVELPSDTTISVVGIGDMNGDGNDDVLTRATDGGWHHYYPMSGRAIVSGGGEVRLTGSVEDLAAWSVPWAQKASGGDFELPDGSWLTYPDRPNVPPAPDTSEMERSGQRDIHGHICSGERDSNGNKDGRWVCLLYSGRITVRIYVAGAVREAWRYSSDGSPSGWSSHHGDGSGMGWSFSDSGHSDFTTYGPHDAHGNAVWEAFGGFSPDGHPIGGWGRYEFDAEAGVWWDLPDHDSSQYRFLTYEEGKLHGLSGYYTADGKKIGCWKTYSEDWQVGKGTYFHSDGSTSSCL